MGSSVAVETYFRRVGIGIRRHCAIKGGGGTLVRSALAGVIRRDVAACSGLNAIGREALCFC